MRPPAPIETNINLNDFRLVVFDIDGTILARGGTLGKFTAETLRRLRTNGLNFTLATGKSLPATRSLAEELNIDLPLILSNGALIQTRQGNILDRSSLPMEITRRVLNVCDQQSQDVVVYIDDCLYVKQMTENMDPIYGNVEEGLLAVGSWEAIGERLNATNKCVAVDTHPQKNLDNLEIEFRILTGRKADVIRSSEELLEVVPKGVDKASGLRILASLIGIDNHQVMAFGDYDNDATMLLAAGLGIAVDGASRAALESADVVVGSCEQEGPAKFLAGLLDKLN